MTQKERSQAAEYIRTHVNNPVGELYDEYREWLITALLRTRGKYCRFCMGTIRHDFQCDNCSRHDLSRYEYEEQSGRDFSNPRLRPPTKEEHANWCDRLYAQIGMAGVCPDDGCAVSPSGLCEYCLQSWVHGYESNTQKGRFELRRRVGVPPMRRGTIVFQSHPTRDEICVHS